MLTTTDLKQIKRLIKGLLNETFQETRREFAMKADLVQLKHELKDDIVKFKDDILHEIVDLRDDFAVLTGYRDMIEDHDQRITKLEERPS
jgi:hypothetical protein